MSEMNWGAIHSAHAEYKGRLGQGAQPPPQPQGHGPLHAMMVEAMSRTNQKPGEDHGSMIIRALSDHLKRISPDTSKIHEGPKC